MVEGSENEIHGAAHALGELLSQMLTKIQFVKCYLLINKARKFFFRKDYFMIFKDPLITNVKKHNILEILLKTLKIDNNFSIFCFILLKMNLLHLMPEIIALFLKDGLSFFGVENGVLISQRRFKLVEIKQFEISLQKKWNLNKVKLHYVQDPEIKSGFIIKTGNRTINYTIYNKISKMKKAIREKAGRYEY